MANLDVRQIPAYMQMRRFNQFYITERLMIADWPYLGQTPNTIPVVRQATVPRRMTDELGPRYFVDLSDGMDFEAGLQRLVMDIHQVRAPLPPLGVPPAPGAA